MEPRFTKCYEAVVKSPELEPTTPKIDVTWFEEHLLSTQVTLAKSASILQLDFLQIIYSDSDSHSSHPLPIRHVSYAATSFLLFKHDCVILLVTYPYYLESAIDTLLIISTSERNCKLYFGLFLSNSD